MAVTASISLNTAGPITIEQQVMATVVVSNSGGSDVVITEIQPTILFTGDSAAVDASSAALGKVLVSSVLNTRVPAGGSSSFIFSVVPHVPSVNRDGTPGTYSISCKIQDSAGDVIAQPTAATIQVNQVPKEASTP